jgi:hypothetical protein
LDNNCDGWKDYLTDEDKDGDGVFWCAGDCDDDDQFRFPGNQEGPYLDATCGDAIDNDCDNYIDNADSGCWDNCIDNDGDGYGFPGYAGCTNGGATDCNDADGSIFPGAPDAICDGIDQNCINGPDDEYVTTPTGCGVGGCADTGQLECQSGVEVDTCTPLAPTPEGPQGDATCSGGVDEDCDGDTDGADSDCNMACIDVDGDGYGSNGDTAGDCPNGAAIDCNDNDNSIFPGAADVTCDGIDQNCVGGADDGYVVTPTNCGVGECGASGQLECISGVETDSCIEGTPGTEGPFGDPTCSGGLDEDCDGNIDSADLDCNPLDKDNDGDGFCEANCTDGSIPGDCDDSTDTVFPNAPVLCDGKDNNCDGWKDYFTDEDKDGDGVFWCAGDCDDDNALRFPGNQEGPYLDATCTDAIDNDCDYYLDNADSGCWDNCIDNDGDGYGFPGYAGCSNGGATDCNDGDASINPGAADAICDGIDQNCISGPDDEYVVTPTGCGVGACADTGQLECQSGVEVDTCIPLLPTPEGPMGDPTCSGGVDEDCDGATDAADPGCLVACIDVDGDGYGSNGDTAGDCPNGPAIDCNDNDNSIFPGAADAICDGIDQNCISGPDDEYVVTGTNCGIGECTTTGQLECQSGVEVDTCIPLPMPEDPEVTCNDGLDNDCDGDIDTTDLSCNPLDIDNDGDGYCEGDPGCSDGSSPGDCDDTDSNVYIGAPIICDGKDSNCDGWKDFSTDEDKDNDGVPWCAGDCDDYEPEEYPGNEEGPFGDPTCSDPYDNDCDGYSNAQDDGCLAPECGTKFAPQDGPHIWDLLDPADDSLIKRNCDWCHLDDTGTIDERNECQRCHAHQIHLTEY